MLPTTGCVRLAAPTRSAGRRRASAGQRMKTGFAFKAMGGLSLTQLKGESCP